MFTFSRYGFAAKAALKPKFEQSTPLIDRVTKGHLCAIYTYKNFESKECFYKDTCYRTRPDHVITFHNDTHIAKPKPQYMMKGLNLKMLYHQTNVDHMLEIMQGNHELAFTNSIHWFGEGIYFAESIEITNYKASRQGVVFCAEVDLGKWVH